MSSLTSQTWVILPVYNEAQYLERVLRRLQKQTKNFIVVDDGSHDESSEIAQRYTPHTLKHIVNLGKGAALKTGCEYAFNHLQAQNVVFMDSDDQHRPEELPAFIEEINQGADIVFGVRSLDPNMPIYKRALNLSLSAVVWLLFGQWLSDILSGYKALTKTAYQQIKWTSTDYAVELEIAIRTIKSQLSTQRVLISTIYHSHDRGMTTLNALHFIFLLLHWRIYL